MSALFISHSSQDNAAATELRSELETQGHHSVFLDFDPEQGIQAGASWERTLYTKLRACRAVVVLCSQNYLASRWCFAEIALARMEGKELFVLQVEPWDEQTELPSILTEKQFIDLRTEKQAGYQRLWNGFKVKGVVPEEHREWGPEDPPYPGLRAFDEKDAAIFFGREAEVQDGLELLNRVRRQGHPQMVAILGASGSGKSSLARAGVVPLLRRDTEQWLVVGPFRPGRRPARALACALADAFEQAGQPEPWETLQRQLDATAPLGSGDDAPGRPEKVARRRLLDALSAFENELETTDTSVIEAVKQLRNTVGSSSAVLAASAPADSGEVTIAELCSRLRRLSQARVVLVIDQFEELLGHDAEGDSHPANRFLRLLRDALDADYDPPLVLATMRSDYLGVFQRSGPFRGVGFKTLSVGPMSRDGMRQVIEQPATLGGIELRNLTEKLLDDTGTSDALPLLAFTLRTMWDRYHKTRLFDDRNYDELGGLHGAIGQVADETLEAALAHGEKDPADNERDLRAAFLKLARPTIEEGTGWARQPASWDRFAGHVQPMLQRFIDNRLLLMRADGTVEVAHEALFRSWEKLRGWLNANSEALHLLGEINTEALKWKMAEPDERKEYRWRGGRLARALELSAGGVLELEELCSDFIEDSHRAELEAIEAETARQRHKLFMARSIAFGASAAALIVLGFFAYAVEQQKRAEDQTRVAIASKLLDRDPTRAALVLLELGKPAKTAGVEQLMSDALAQPLAVLELGGHAAAIVGAAFDRDGERILTVSGDTVYIWHADGSPVIERGEPVALLHEELGAVEGSSGQPESVQVNSAAFSPAGGLIVTGSKDGTVRLWSDNGNAVPVAGGTNAFSPRHEGQVYSVAWDSTGKRILSASEDWKVRVWTSRGEPVPKASGDGDLELKHPPGKQPKSAVFDTGDERILTASNEGTAWVWNLDGEEIFHFQANNHPLRSAAFGPGGQIVTASSDGIARLWSTENDQPVLGPELPHRGEVLGISLWKHQVITASDDGTARIWNANDGSPVSLANGRDVILRHLGGVTSAVVSPAGDLVLTASKDGSARLWSTDWSRKDRVEPLILTSEIDALGAGKRGFCRPPGTVASTGEGPRPSTCYASAVFGPDGARILTARTDGIAELWHSESGAALSPSNAPAGSQTDARRDNVWSTDGSGWPNNMTGHESLVLGASVSAEGDRIVSFSEDGSARLWQADGRAVLGKGGEPVVLRHSDMPRFPIMSATLSSGPDARIITTSRTGTAQIWWAEDGAPYETQNKPLVIKHSPPMYGAAFSPDGHRILTASRAAAVRLWSFDDITRRPAKVSFTELRTPGIVYSAAFNADGDRIVAASDLDVFVFDLNRSQRIGPFRGHEQDVLTAGFSHDGNRLVTGSRDRTARLWNAARPQEPILVLRHGKDVRAAEFDPQGGRVVTISLEPAARIWRVTYEGLGAHVRDVSADICLDTTFRIKTLNERASTATNRYQRCTRCLGAFRNRPPGVSPETAFDDYRDCILPMLR